MPHKLLLADDSVTIQRVIELTFADEDVQVIAVGNGADAIERAQRDRPDIVLADVGMPERNGYEVAAFIKGTPSLAHIPGRPADRRVRAGRRGAGPLGRLRRRAGEAVRAAARDQPRQGPAGREAAVGDVEAAGRSRRGRCGRRPPRPARDGRAAAPRRRRTIRSKRISIISTPRSAGRCRTRRRPPASGPRTRRFRSVPRPQREARSRPRPAAFGRSVRRLGSGSARRSGASRRRRGAARVSDPPRSAAAGARAGAARSAAAAGAARPPPPPAPVAPPPVAAPAPLPDSVARRRLFGAAVGRTEDRPDAVGRDGAGTGRALRVAGRQRRRRDRAR